MANPEHLDILKQGVADWNAWRAREPSICPDLSEANLFEANLHEVDLTMANFGGACLNGANLFYANLYGANLTRASLPSANLGGANLTNANAVEASLQRVNLRGANLTEATLIGADLSEGTDLKGANLSGAKLRGANLSRADLWGANLSGADLEGANLISAILVNTDLTGADLTGCRIYGASAWDLKLERATQQCLVITPEYEPEIAVDNIEVAQFVHLLLHNEKIRDVIDTIGKKGVLLLGRFTEDRITVLKRLREALRERGYVPIVFNFDKPETKDFTETVRLLAGMAKFVIADITNPKSTPLELQATVPEIMVPFQPIIESGEQPFAMLQDLWIKHREWVFEPIEYSSVDRLIEALDSEIIVPAQTRFNELVLRKAERMTTRRV